MTISKKERTEILRQLAEQKISAAEAAELLNGSEAEANQAEDAVPGGGSQTLSVTEEDILKSEEPEFPEAKRSKDPASRPSWIHVRVSDLRSGKDRVTVNIPLRLVGLGLNIGSRFAPELEGLDWRSIKDTLYEEKGILVDVTDEQDGEHVLIYVD